MLPPHERAVIGESLQAPDGASRKRIVSVVERLLTELASEQANAKRVLHRSDNVAELSPVLKAARALRRALTSMHPAAAGFMKLQGQVSREEWDRELAKIEAFDQWIRSMPSEKGGERPAYEKFLRAKWPATLRDYFDILYKQLHGGALPRRGLAKRRRDFVRVSIAAIEAALAVKS